MSKKMILVLTILVKRSGTHSTEQMELTLSLGCTEYCTSQHLAHLCKVP